MAFRTISISSCCRRTGITFSRSSIWPCRACRRSRRAGVKELINGPESFTPDGNFIIGPAPGLTGYYVGAGFNAFGIASGGGAGKVLAEWIVGGEAPFDVWPVDIRRFGAPHRDIDWVRERTLELYGKHYTIAWPGEEHASGRPLRRSPLYEQLKAQGAVFGEKLGWERPNWFAAGSEDAARRVQFRAPELVCGRGARTPGDARARRAVRSELVRQISAESARTPSAR